MIRLWVLAGVVAAGASAATAYQPAGVGCAMAHCDVHMSDNSHLNPPTTSSAYVKYHDTNSSGAGNPYGGPKSPNQGLGCAGNGRIAVCSYSNTNGNNLVAYQANGTRLWTSGNLFDLNAFASVAMINSSNSVIMADDKSIIRFNSDGSIMWQTATPGGIPISPVITQSGAVILATSAGPISAFDSGTGQLLGSIVVTNPATNTNFITSNTPCVSGNRVYVTMTLPNDPNNTGWLVALDVNTANVNPLAVAWHYTFGGPTYASPTLIGTSVYFDAGRVSPGSPSSPQMLAVTDNGTTPSLLWMQPAPATIPVSFCVDPRGGFWVIFTGNGTAQHRSSQTGALLEGLNVTSLVGDPNPNFPWSNLTMEGSSTNPILVMGTISNNFTSAYVIAVNPVTHTLLWKINLIPALGTDNAVGQFPIIIDPTTNKPLVVFAGRTTGAYFISDP